MINYDGLLGASKFSSNRARIKREKAIKNQMSGEKKNRNRSFDKQTNGIRAVEERKNGIRLVDNPSMHMQRVRKA